MLPTYYVRSKDGKFVGTLRTDTLIIVTLLMAGFLATATWYIFSSHTYHVEKKEVWIQTSVDENGVPTYDGTTDAVKAKERELIHTTGIHWNDDMPNAKDEVLDHWKSVYPHASTNTLNVIIKTAERKGIKDIDRVLALVSCESKFNPFAVNAVGNSPAGSVDRGLWQVSNFWQKKVTDADAFDVQKSTNFALDQIAAGRESLWSCSKLIK